MLHNLTSSFPEIAECHSERSEESPSNQRKMRFFLVALLGMTPYSSIHGWNLIRLVGFRLNCSLIVLALAVALWSAGCGGGNRVSHRSQPATQQKPLARMGYSIQVGAFANLDNAVRLSKVLNRQGLNAYYFIHESGLYKVRFGNFASKKSARTKAEAVRAASIINEYYLVRPTEYTAVKQRKYGDSNYLRKEIVGTARRFIGVPYRWGGSSRRQGFDCSGLTMVVYQLNGLNLPRSSRQQYRVGTPVKRTELSEGDLVFFATSGGRRVSHVGIYVGRGRFIHAPGRGKRIQTELLSKRYFKTRYVGARTYLN